MTQDPQRSREPRVSVIVTNYNYGHFLPACLDSLRRQTRPPDEIVVVNDGSTDASAGLLAGETGIEVITQENLGQAAAFNAGFRATTGEIVVFLDADDRLKPHALDAIRLLWSGQFSVLSFDLEMIDRDGRPAGRYEMRVPEIDLAPRLYRDLAMPFMPTSGNAFRRDAIAWAFPMPEPRWKVSADAVLIRAAVHAGPVRHLRQTLGEYRIHRHNNWFRDVAAGDWRLQRGHADIAQTGLDLVRLAPRAPGGLAPAARLMLLFAAVRARIKADALTGDPSDTAAFLGEVGRAWPAAHRLPVKLLLRLLAIALPRSRRLRHWAIARPERPEIVERLLSAVIGRRLRAEMAGVAASRAPFGITWQGGGRPLDAHFPGRPWCRHWAGTHFELCAPSGQIVFRRTAARPAELLLDVAPPEGCLAEVTVLQEGTVLDRFTLAARGGIPIPLRSTAAVAPRDDRIEIRVDACRPGPLSRLRRPGWACARLRVHGIDLAPAAPEPTGAVLPVSVEGDFGALAASASAPGSERGGEGALAHAQTLLLGPPPLAPPCCLSLVLGPGQPEGWLTLAHGAATAFSGRVGPSARILAELGREVLTGEGPIRLEAVFRPEDALGTAALAIDRIGWLPGPAETRGGVRLLPANAWVLPSGRDGPQGFLDGDWSAGAPPVFHGASAGLTFALPPGPARARHLKLDVEPALPLPGDGAIVFVVSVNGRRKTAVRLAGRDLITVALDPEDAARGDAIEVGLHAAAPRTDGAPGAHGGVVLHGFGIAGPEAVVPDSRPSAAPAPPGLVLAGLRRAHVTRRSGADLRDLRAALDGEIAGLAAKALEDFLTADALSLLTLIGRRTMPDAPPDADAAGLEGQGEGAEWLRAVARAMLSGPAWSSAPGLRLSALPACDLSYAHAIGAWMGTPPAPGTGRAAAARYGDAMGAWLAEAREAFASALPGTPAHAIADSLLSAFDAAAMAGDPDTLDRVAGAFAGALGARLAAEGHDLWTLRTVRRSGRVALLVATPDALGPGRHAAQLADALSGAGEVVAFAAGAGSDATRIAPSVSRLISLAGQPLGESVAAVRRTAPDAVLVAGDLRRADPLAEIAAHRLAPRQVAVYPGAAPAFTAIDGGLRGACFRPDGEDRQRGILDAPGLGFRPDRIEARGDAAASRALARARLGLAGERTAILVALPWAGGPGAADLACALLAQIPGATVVVAPDAAAWTVEDAEDLRLLLADRLAAASPDGIRMLPPASPDMLVGAAAAADLLVTAGRTAEAALHPFLATGLPGVALAGSPEEARRAVACLSGLGIDLSVSDDALAAAAATARLAGDQAGRAGLREALGRVRRSPPGEAAFEDWLRSRIGGGALPAAPRYLLHHMPKAGGTSLRNMFTEWFPVTQDYKDWWSPEIPPPLDLSQIGPGGMLAGHFGTDGMPLAARYPETADPARWRRITFVRDPLEQALSWYAFEKTARPKHDPDFRPVPLGTFLGSYEGAYLAHFECGPDDWRAALDGYWFIGTLERLEECVDHLARRLGKPMPEILHYHRTAGKEVPEPADVEAFARRMALEFEIYREITRRLAVRLGEPPFDRTAP